MSKLDLVLFRFGDSEPLAQDFVAMYEHNSRFNVVEINEADKVNDHFAKEGHGILLLKISNKEDLQHAIEILKGQRKLVRKNLFKSAALLSSSNSKVEKILNRYGCVDFFNLNMNPKALSYKVEYWAKPIFLQLEKIESEIAYRKKAQEAADSSKSGHVKTIGGAKSAKEDFKRVEPLNLESDIWLVKNKADCKKVLRRWLLRLKGPSPKVGHWAEVEPQPGDKLPTWKFVEENPNRDDFIKNEGAWFFYGSRPDFDWKEKLWSFSSEFPHLYFYDKSGEVYSRFKFKDDQILLAENSDFALAKEELLDDSCNSHFSISAGGVIVEEKMIGSGKMSDSNDGKMVGHFDSEGNTNQAGNLTGKGGTDKYGENALSGKSSTDKLGEKPLVGKGGTEKYGEEALSGKSSTDKLGEKPLSGKGGTDKMGEAPLAGKSSTDKMGEAPLVGKTSTDKMGEAPLAGKSSTDKMGEAPLSGKSSTDKMGEAPISGKVSTDKIGEKLLETEIDSDSNKIEKDLDGKAKTDHLGSQLLDTKESSKKMAQSGGVLSGKTSTDKMGEDPLSGKGSPADTIGGSPLAGKSSTDKMGEAPLAGKSSTDKIGEDPLSGKGSPADMIGGSPLSGKSSTDKMGEAPLAGKTSTDKMGEAPLAGKTSTDKMGEAPLAGKTSTDKMGEAPLAGKTSTDKMGEAPLAGKTSTDKMGEAPLAGKTSTDKMGEAPLAGKTSTDKMGEAPLAGKGAPADVIGKALDTSEEVKPIEGVINGKAQEEEVSPNKDLKDLIEGKKAEDSPQPGIIDNSLAKAKAEIKHDTIDLNAELHKKQNEEIIDIDKTVGKNAFELARDKKQDKSSEQGSSTRTSMNNSIHDAQSSASSHSDVGRDTSNTIAKRDERASEMENLLGGGLTEKLIGDNVGPNLSLVPEDLAVDEEELPNAEDINLESGELKVVLNQKTDSGNVISLICEFEDFFEEELVVRAPKGALQTGSTVEASVILSYGGKNINVESAGKVLEVDESDTEKTETLTVELSSVDTKKYETFMTLYQERQQNIADFMKVAKGF